MAGEVHLLLNGVAAGERDAAAASLGEGGPARGSLPPTRVRARQGQRIPATASHPRRPGPHPRRAGPGRGSPGSEPPAAGGEPLRICGTSQDTARRLRFLSLRQSLNIYRRLLRSRAGSEAPLAAPAGSRSPGPGVRAALAPRSAPGLGGGASPPCARAARGPRPSLPPCRRAAGPRNKG